MAVKSSRRSLLALPFAAAVGVEPAEAGGDVIGLLNSIQANIRNSLAATASSFGTTLDLGQLSTVFTRFGSVIWAPVVGFESLELNSLGGELVAVAYLKLRKGSDGPKPGTYALRVDETVTNLQFLNTRRQVVHSRSMGLGADSSPARLDIEYDYSDVDLFLYNGKFQMSIDFDFRSDRAAR